MCVYVCEREREREREEENAPVHESDPTIEGIMRRFEFINRPLEPRHEKQPSFGLGFRVQGLGSRV